MEDIKIDENEHLVIDGDFLITSENGVTNDRQNIYDIISTYQGHWRGSPRIGVGLDAYLGSPNGDLLVRNIESQLYGDNFRIDLHLTSTKSLSGSGRLCNVSSEDITDYEPWIEEKIIGVFKNLIGLFSGQSNKEKMEKEMIRLIYNSLALRFKIEYI